MTVVEYKSIDLRTCLYSAKYYSRKIWQVLFDEIRAEPTSNLSNMDSLLCDLYLLEREFEDHPRGWKLWWSWHPMHCYTDITYYNPHNERQLYIEYLPEENKIIFSK